MVFSCCCFFCQVMAAADVAAINIYCSSNDLKFIRCLASFSCLADEIKQIQYACTVQCADKASLDALFCCCLCCLAVYPSNSLNFTSLFSYLFAYFFFIFMVSWVCVFILFYFQTLKFIPQTLLHIHTAINSNLMKKSNNKIKLKLYTIVYSEYNPFHCIYKMIFLAFICARRAIYLYLFQYETP